MTDYLEDAVEDEPSRPFGVLRKIDTGLHHIAGALLVAMMLLAVANVVGRRFFSLPIAGTIELTEVAMALIVYLGFAHAQDKGDHIAVDIVYLKLPAKARALLSALGALFCMVVVGLLTWQLFLFGVRMHEGGYTTPVLRIPTYLVAFAAWFGALMFALALVGNGVRSVRRLVGGRS